MTDDASRILGGLESKVEYHDKMLDEILAEVKSIRHTLDEARGGGKVLLWLVGLTSGVMGALAVKLFHLITPG